MTQRHIRTRPSGGARDRRINCILTAALLGLLLAPLPATAATRSREPAHEEYGFQMVSGQAAATTLEIAIQVDHLPAELILLPNQRPVRIDVRVRRKQPPPVGVREVNAAAIRLEADAGRLAPLVEAAGAEPTAWTFYPPADSRMVTVRATRDVKLERMVFDAPRLGEMEQVWARQEAELRLLTPVSSSQMVGGILDGYEIGEYPDPWDPETHRKYQISSRWYETHPERYQVPDFFYKVEAHTRDMEIAPDQTLGFWAIDFPWKSYGLPQYIALDLQLVRKITDLLNVMRADGYRITRFVSIYGFRSPRFNLGTILTNPETNLKEAFSMHQYGRAIDLVIDENGDGNLDDLNGDGIVDIHDAAVIMYYANQLDRQYRAERRMELVGGAGLYTHNDFVERVRALGQSPYIHIDTRGFLNGDGTLVRWPRAWPDGDTIFFGRINPDGFLDPHDRAQASLPFDESF